MSVSICQSACTLVDTIDLDKMTGHDVIITLLTLSAPSGLLLLLLPADRQASSELRQLK